MCEAATIIGGLLSAGSMAANSAAQSQVTKARNDALAANDIRQRANQSKIDALNAKSQQSYDGFGAGQEDKAKSLASYFTDTNGQAAAPQGAGQPTEVMPGATSNIVVQEQAKQSRLARSFTDQQGEALGNLRSFGDYLGGLNRTQARDAGAIGQFGNFQQGDAAVLPYALESANHAGDGLKEVADMARAGGSLATSYGLLRNAAPPKDPELPSMANVPAAGTQTIAGLGAALPKHPLLLSLPSAYLPAFARAGMPYGV